MGTSGTAALARSAWQEGGIAAVAKDGAHVEIRGKFFFVGDQKFYIRGVTYGTFCPDADGHEFPQRAVVERDFEQMAAAGLNAVRTYTVPPVWMLDIARECGLRLMVGLPAERSAGFLDYRTCRRSVEEMVREKVRACAGHPAVLCYSIGNEIPASLVRWQGKARTEHFLHRLYRAVKAEDPEALVTYVNYPSTEYLELPFLDFVCFNVYLESQPRLDAYVAQLQTIAADRPLVMGELGLDSIRKGEEAQGRVLEWQIRTAFASGCAGAFVYSWTDEWYRGGAEVYDWAFGITDRRRRPKPAMERVREAFAEVPLAPNRFWPRVSVVVCSHNGSRTIGECCAGLQRLLYPNYEVIVVNDGSTDRTAAICSAFGCKVITTPNRGLSHARNTGLEAATGEIVAYIDDDAYPDPHWLSYLVSTFLHPSGRRFAGVGGPNIPPPHDGLVADCVAHSPGGPVHVLLTDRKAEHIPGCNMAFRAPALRAIGGFDPQFCAAGDDVDVCWKLQKEGWSLGFSPAAVVWHHRRNSVLTYWKQQHGYGRAEAKLERKWPEKYNVAGHPTWNGRIYGNGNRSICWRPARVYHGVWGKAPFQHLQQPDPSLWEWLPTMPEWYLLVVGLGMVSLLGLVWEHLKLAWPVLVLGLCLSLLQAVRCSMEIANASGYGWRNALWRRFGLTVFLHLTQPVARLIGRLRYGLTLWRRRPLPRICCPRPWTADVWCRSSTPGEARLRFIEAHQRLQGTVPLRGGQFDRWDLEVRGGIFGSARLALGAESHGSGRQLLRIRCWPRCSWIGGVLTAVLAALILQTASDGAWIECGALSVALVALASRIIYECAFSTGAFLSAVKEIERTEKLPVAGSNGETSIAPMAQSNRCVRWLRAIPAKLGTLRR